MEEPSRIGDFVLFILFYLVLKKILSPDNPWLFVFSRFDQSIFLIDQKNLPFGLQTLEACQYCGSLFSLKYQSYD